MVNNLPLSLEEIDMALASPRSFDFTAISPDYEMSGSIAAYFYASFGEDSGSAQRWLNNKLISLEDLKATATFRDEPNYHFCHPESAVQK